MDALPPRARLLHVGLMKTGTTALQMAASRRRRALLRHGVRYPGWNYNHRSAAQALFDRTAYANRSESDDWDRLMAQIDADRSRRILISNELIAVADATVVRRFRDELGPRTHVVFTVRSFASILPSLWQQYVKSGHRRDFEEFLHRRIGDSGRVSRDMARHDQGVLVTRWAEVFGPENVTVIVVDKNEPRRVSDAFEALLDLPSGMLDEPEMSGESRNRSLSMREASLILAANRALAPYGVDQREIDRLLFRGATARMLSEAEPPTADTQIVLPPWAVEPALARSRQHAEVIAASGVRVVGDLAELSRPPRTDRGQWQVTSSVPTDTAAQALVGALSAGMNRGSNFGLPGGVEPGTRDAVLGRVRMLAAAVRRRLGRTRTKDRDGET